METSTSCRLPQKGQRRPDHRSCCCNGDGCTAQEARGARRTGTRTEEPTQSYRANTLTPQCLPLTGTQETPTGCSRGCLLQSNASATGISSSLPSLLMGQRPCASTCPTTTLHSPSTREGHLFSRTRGPVGSPPLGVDPWAPSTQSSPEEALSYHRPPTAQPSAQFLTLAWCAAQGGISCPPLGLLHPIPLLLPPHCSERHSGMVHAHHRLSPQMAAAETPVLGAVLTPEHTSTNDHEHNGPWSAALRLYSTGHKHHRATAQWGQASQSTGVTVHSKIIQTHGFTSPRSRGATGARVHRSRGPVNRDHGSTAPQVHRSTRPQIHSTTGP